MDLPSQTESIEFLRELTARIRSGAMTVDEPFREAARAFQQSLTESSPDDASSDNSEMSEQSAREAGNWNRVIEILLARLDGTTKTEDRVALLCQVSRIFEQETGDLAKAFATLCAALRETYPSQEIAQNLERMAEEVGLWKELLTEYEQLAATLKDPQQRCDEWLGIAQLYTDKLGQTDAALAAHRQAHKLCPQRLDVLTSLAQRLRQARHWAELGSILLEQTEIENGVDKLARLLEAGNVFESRAEDFDQALLSYQRVCEMDPTQPEALAGLERIYRRRELWEPLGRLLQQRLQHASTEQKVALELELASLHATHLEDSNAAAEHARNALVLDANNLPALSQLETLYEKLGRTQDSLEMLQRRTALVIPSERVPLLLRLATEWEDLPLGRDRAVTFLQQALSIDPQNSEVARLLLRLLRKDKRQDALASALERYESIAADDRERREVRGELAQLYEQSGKAAEACAVWQRLLDAEPESKPALQAQARLCEQIGDYAQAVHALEKLVVLETGAARATLQVQLGLLFRDRLREPGRAEEELVRALEVDPKQIPARWALVELYRERGEGLRAAKNLADIGRISANLLERVRALVEAAELYEEAHEHRQAIGLLREALTHDPEHVEALRRLLAILEAEGRVVEAKPVLELLRRKTNPSDRRGMFDLHVKLAHVASLEGRANDALIEYRAARELDAQSQEVLSAIANLAEPAGLAPEALSALTALLALTPADGSLFARLARLHRQSGDEPQAINFLEKAVAANGEDVDSWRALTELYRARQDFPAVVRTLGARAAASDREDRYHAWMESAEILASELGDKVGAARALREAATTRPKGLAARLRLLDFATERRDWSEALDILAQLTSIEEERERRARYHYSAAVILRDELHDDNQAFKHFEQSLDDDPQRAKAFSAIERMLEARGAWSELAQAIERQIARLGERQETLDTRGQLWARLGDLREKQLADPESATAAWEAASTLNPNDVELRRRLAEAYVSTSTPNQLERGVAAATGQLRLDPYNAESWRLLGRLYKESGRADRALAVSQALALLGQGSGEPQRPETIGVLPHEPIGDESLLRLVKHANENPYLQGVFRTVTPLAESLAARPAASFGLDRCQKLAPSDSNKLGEAMRKAARWLGVALPDLYVDETGRGVHPVNLKNGAGGHFALIVGRDLATSETEAEARFEAARGLVLARSEYRLAWAIPYAPALRSLFWAAVTTARPSAQIPEDVEAHERVATYLRKNLTPEALATLTDLLGGMPSDADPNVQEWLGAVELTAARAGLVFSGDLAVAARIVGSDPAGRYSLPAKERVKELLLYAVSDEYFQLCAQIRATSA